MQLTLEHSYTLEALENKVGAILESSQKHGASAAEVSLVHTHGFNTSLRNQAVETVEFTRDKSLSLLVYCGQKKASVSTSDLSDQAIEQCIKAAISIAKAAEEDPYTGLVDKEYLAKNKPDLSLDHPRTFETDDIIELARSIESEAFAVDPKIKNAEGTEINLHRNLRVYASANSIISSVSKVLG
ncbi:MAG: PmbA/TldA family metallopeptidase [Gammaproteobacteria bacterium]